MQFRTHAALGLFLVSISLGKGIYLGLTSTSDFRHCALNGWSIGCLDLLRSVFRPITNYKHLFGVLQVSLVLCLMRKALSYHNLSSHDLVTTGLCASWAKWPHTLRFQAPSLILVNQFWIGSVNNALITSEQISCSLGWSGFGFCCKSVLRLSSTCTLTCHRLDGYVLQSTAENQRANHAFTTWRIISTSVFPHLQLSSRLIFFSDCCVRAHHYPGQCDD